MSDSSTTIAVLPVDGDEARSVRLVGRRTHGWLRRLTGDRRSPEAVADRYWPVELGVASATVEQPLRQARPVRVPIARDLVTGRVGTVDVRVGDAVPVQVATSEVVAPGPSDEDEWREFARNQVVLKHRPTAIHDLRIIEAQRVHIPYHLVALGERRFLVDRLMGRVDAVEELPVAVRA